VRIEGGWLPFGKSCVNGIQEIRVARLFSSADKKQKRGCPKRPGFTPFSFDPFGQPRLSSDKFLALFFYESRFALPFPCNVFRDFFLFAWLQIETGSFHIFVNTSSLTSLLEAAQSPVN